MRRIYVVCCEELLQLDCSRFAIELVFLFCDRLSQQNAAKLVAVSDRAKILWHADRIGEVQRGLAVLRREVRRKMSDADREPPAHAESTLHHCVEGVGQQ